MIKKIPKDNEEGGNSEGLLRAARLKVTPARQDVLRILGNARWPLSVRMIAGMLGPAADQVTAYRTLEVLAAAGIVRSVDLGHGHAHFELVAGREHHHHLVCESCGAIEDVASCGDRTLERAVLKRSKSFASIRTHALEFFGLCAKCAERLKRQTV